MRNKNMCARIVLLSGISKLRPIFFVNVGSKYSIITKTALRMFILFAAAYGCEGSFPTVVIINIKVKNHLKGNAVWGEILSKH